ncbi:MAG: Asp23/Gls24 family envelope stress response protein [Defluviitaleaceae bacterium]|nr:Asp23/Gls24 family envelope stress response protein [Defluviitaleaceae bacterium]
MTELKTERGDSVRISDEVLAIIAGTAALETEGVAALVGPGRRGRARGISVVVKKQSVMLGILLKVKAEKKLQEVSREVQQRVKSAIETMTGMRVAGVNVTVVA